MDFLQKIEPAGPSDLRKALKTFSMKCTGKGIVVLLSDFMDKGGYEEAIRYLHANAVEILGEPATRYGARGMGLSIYLRDPEGNVVELKQMPPAGSP